MSTILLGILAAVIAEQLSATFPSLALKLVRWSAGRRYAGNPARAEVRAEELEALIEERPGGLLKLTTALGFAAATVWSAVRRALGEHPVITIARAVIICSRAVWNAYVALCFLIGGAIMVGLMVGISVGSVAVHVTGTLGPDIGFGMGIAAARVCRMVLRRPRLCSPRRCVPRKGRHQRGRATHHAKRTPAGDETRLLHGRAVVVTADPETPSQRSVLTSSAVDGTGLPAPLRCGLLLLTWRVITVHYHSLRAWFRRMADFGLWMSPQNPHKSASAAGGPHKNSTYKTALPGTRRHGR
jgi:hypothetical protein